MLTEYWRRGLIVILLAVLVTPLIAAEVVVFDQYITKATVDGDIIHVERDVRIKNVGSTPIIPGELHFRLYEQDGAKKIPLDVTGFSATSARNEQLATKISERKGETDLSIQLWNPLLPGFHFDFTMQYDLEFKPSGVLFYEIKLPQEETTIPIVNEETQFSLGKKYHVTYAPGSNVNKISGNTVVVWDDSDERRVVEYSRLPFPKIGLRAVNIFWLVIIIALVAVFVLSVRKQRMRPKATQTANNNAPYQQQYQYQQHRPPWQGGR